MKTVTLLQLRTDARLYADQRVASETNAFITATELTRLINLQIGELYDMLVAARGHEHYATSGTVSVVAGTAGYNLPSDFYQLQAVNLEWASDDVEPVEPLNHQQDIWLHQNYSYSWQRWSRKAYRLRGSQIVFYPTPTSAVTARLYYVPTFTDLSADADTFNGVNGWEKVVALGVAIEMLEIEESGSGARLQAAFDRQLERIEGLAADRDASTELQVRDVSGRRVQRYPTATGTT